MNSPAASAPGSAKRSVGVVGAALLVATVLGAIIPIVCARLLPVVDYRYFLAFWGLIFGFGSALSCVEQEVSRQASLASIAGRRLDSSAFQVVGSAGIAIGVVAAAVCIPELSSRLFGSYTWLAVLAAVGGVGFAAQFGVRGVLVGEQRVVAYGGLVVTEALVRAALVLVAAVLSIADIYVLAIAVAAGSFGWVLFVASIRTSVAPRDRGEGWRASASRIAVLMISAALTASVITGYPAMVNILAPSDDGVAVSGLFAALTVARFPLIIVSPVLALAVPAVVRLSVTSAGYRKLRTVLLAGIAATVVVGVASAVVCAWAGPTVVRLVFGPGFVVSGLVVAGLGWSSVVLGACLLMTAVLVAREQVVRVLAIWATVAVGSAVVLLVWPGATVTKAVAGLVIAPTIGLLVACALVLTVRECGDQPAET